MKKNKIPGTYHIFLRKCPSIVGSTHFTYDRFMYKNAGHLRKPTVFLFTEAEIKDEVGVLFLVVVVDI